MSVTLTGRDTYTETLNQAQLTPSGVIYAVAGGNSSEVKEHQARFTNVRQSAGMSRSNLHSERKKRDAAGKMWALKVDTTIAVENGNPFTADEIDDFLIAHQSYFDSEATTQDFVLGFAKS